MVLKKLFSGFSALAVAVSAFAAMTVTAGATENTENTVEIAKIASINGYTSNMETKYDNEANLGGTNKGGSNDYDYTRGGHDASVTFIKVDTSKIPVGTTKSTLSFSDGKVLRSRTGNINIYVGTADTSTTVVTGQTAIGENWSSVTWTTRPKVSEFTQNVSATKTITAGVSFDLDITSQLAGKTSGYVTIAVMGQTVNNASGSQGEAQYSTVTLSCTTNEMTAATVTKGEGSSFSGTVDGNTITNGGESVSVWQGTLSRSETGSTIHMIAVGNNNMTASADLTLSTVLSLENDANVEFYVIVDKAASELECVRYYVD